MIWFRKDSSAQGDTDNLLKPIHDALKGAAYLDDRAIVATASFRIDTTGTYIIESDPADPDSHFQLLNQLDRQDTRDVLYIEIGQQTETRVRLGPLT